MKSFRLLFLFVFLASVSGQTIAQQKLQIVEKTIENDIPGGKVEAIKIVCEKADARIQGWDQDYIKFTLKLTARHENKEVASRELSYIKYAITYEDGIIEFRNRFDFPDEVRYVKSTLSVLYDIKVPFRVLLQLEGKYSNIELTDLTHEVDGTFEFGNVKLNKLSGEVKLNSTYADVIGHDINATFFCRTNKANIYLENLHGSYRINSSLGTVVVLPNNVLSDLTIFADRTATDISIGDFDAYSYSLSTDHGVIDIKYESYAQKIITTDKSQYFNLKRKAGKPLIKIFTSYNKITLNK
ncbi:MAG: hypothetical protein IM631_21055 [Cytophagales bacterium]|jgi:hypothetical protein|nr:hypothetical protein [Cytophagales bacterium]MCA6373858.1 hypothetical protein [Cytophagales bacterium]MCA6374412.1 hypothetical protein [Cytophagales bacterium]MCA6384517.1 hypothetical protein [Cytophagales bacterium]MCE2894247.1 hypothetical protein [Flammeovirgaceae bacterium]